MKNVQIFNLQNAEMQTSKITQLIPSLCLILLLLIQGCTKEPHPGKCKENPDSNLVYYEFSGQDSIDYIYYYDNQLVPEGYFDKLYKTE